MTTPSSNRQYKLVPPDGGFGIFVVIGATVIVITNQVPMGGFGIVFGGFLSKVGDETTGTTLANGLFNTVMSFTGLLANVLLKKYSCRTVGLVGAFVYSTGAFALIFVEDLLAFIIFFGVIQGLGFGLLFPASCTAFNSYFDKKMNLMMNISQTVMGVANMAGPMSEAFLMNYYGYRGTVALIAALSLFNFPATTIMEPVTRHMKKVPLETLYNDESIIQPERSKSLTTDLFISQIQPILHPNLDAVKSKSHRHIHDEEFYNLPPSKSTLMQFGDRSTSVQTIYEHRKAKKFSRAGQDVIEEKKSLVDLSLLKDPVYINITTGLSLGYTSDIAFISIIPLVLEGLNFNTSQVALMLLVFFGSDLLSRIIFLVASAFFSFRNRHLFWFGTLFTALSRILFMLNDSFIWRLITIGAIGFFRCLIQTPLPLVISDEYSQNFATAFSLFMVVCGLVSLIFGPLIRLLANVLLKKYSCRTVGLVGAFVYSTGAFALIFVEDLLAFIIFFGVIQGLGFGLLFPASCTAFNSYFDKKMNLMMNISQTVMGVANMAGPMSEAFLMNYYGYRGTVALIAALSLFNFPATTIMEPVTRHMKKVPLETLYNDESIIQPERSKSLTTDLFISQIQPILHPNLDAVKSKSHRHIHDEEFYNLPPSKSTLMQFGDRSTSVQTIYEHRKAKKFSRAGQDVIEEKKSLVDLSLLKDPVYINITTGLSLGYTSDIAFISIIPLVLEGLNFNTSQVALMLLVFFGSDLLSRIIFLVASAFFSFRNRHLFWFGTLFTALSRILFMLNDSFIWRLITIGAIGFFRCLIQTPLPLVISDEYSQNFATAFSLFMVVCGLVSLIFGPLISVIKGSTGSDAMVCHLLTGALFICVLSWLVEYLLLKRRKQGQQN